MKAPTRFLPSIASLRALEALDRLGSVSAVAKEVSQTQSAVSRQLQTLEAQLGVSLILRSAKRVQMTPEARNYAMHIRTALETISRASLDVTLTPQGSTLNLAILPTFGMRWLVPKLADFTRRNPDITLNMATRLQPFDFATEQFDAALHFGAADWPGGDHLRLKTELLVAVCAPSVLAGQALARATEVSALPLLHIATRPTAWSDWFSQQGFPDVPVDGTVYDQFSTITQAVLHGLGVALLPKYLVEQDLATGRMVIAFDHVMKSDGAYYLVWPSERTNDPALRYFRSWLAAQAEDEDALAR